ncbi:hypothetical protein SASPL_112297 [Salvia splendens]|uniref:Uncharacterized protein n=1 Tax=Salvia splendens TaxID=180675 RepID=A0A8X8YAZ2_SALSN|nr:hypothetical protein SASPL_112297 [Salvia splendens]
MGGGDQGAQQALQNLAGLLLLPRRHRPRIRHRHLLLRGPTARLNVPDCVPEYCHQDLSAAAIRKKATEDVVLYCKCFRKKGNISYVAKLSPTLESDQDLITVLRYRRIHAQTPPLCDAYTNPNNVLALDQGSCSSSDGSHISHQSFSFQGIDDHHQNLFFNDAGTSTSSSNYACFNDNPQDYYSSIEEIKEFITINDGSPIDP